MKRLFIAEKPSVAQEFAKALGVNGERHDGYVESGDTVVTWCVGHLVTMSYPEKYDARYKKWSLDTLPFIPTVFKYEIIPDVSKQFKIVSGLLEREDIGTIYVCTDSGREGEYIYRLVEMMSGPKVAQKDRRRVWIDSFTEEEIGRGIREAKDLSAYDNLSESAFLRAKEDYLMGINFSRLLTLKYGNEITNYLKTKWSAVSVGRVMTCVLGMVVRREREIRSFVKTPFYRVLGTFGGIEAEWKAVKGSAYQGSPKLYKENGFKERADAEALIAELKKTDPYEGIVTEISRRKEKKNAPLLYNLAELQNDCSRMYKISPDQTLAIAQELYEKKLTTYPRTDARVLSTAVAKVIDRNLKGLTHFAPCASFAEEVLNGSAWKTIGKTRYTDDKAITDHYAIIPTGAGLQNLRSLKETSARVYQTIVRRFLAIFYPPAEFDKTAVTIKLGIESFFSNFRVLTSSGYMKVFSGGDGNVRGGNGAERGDDGTLRAGGTEIDSEGNEHGGDEAAPKIDLSKLRKGMSLPVQKLEAKEGETSPPKRYTSGSMILAMENAGQLIEDDSLREMIKGSGIGTSATRAEILKKLVNIKYLSLNKKTQVITPELLGEMVYDTVTASIRPLLNPELTASWEKGLTGVAEGAISPEEYMEKLTGFITRRTAGVMNLNNKTTLRKAYDAAAVYYKTAAVPQRSREQQGGSGTKKPVQKGGSGTKKPAAEGQTGSKKAGAAVQV